jgi:hypothetical protein
MNTAEKQTDKQSETTDKITSLENDQRIAAAEQQAATDAEVKRQQEVVDTVQAQERNALQGLAQEKHDSLISEAVEAVAKTAEVLAALEAGDTEKAIQLLEEITGKLEIVLSAHPELNIAPVDVKTFIFDIRADVPAILLARKNATHLLVDGELQKVRRLIEPLRSEIVIEVTGLPLATYPEAIKAIVPLIKDGKIDEAIQALQEVLRTLVVEEEIVPLPILRAQLLLEQAETLAENARSDEHQHTLDVLLNAAAYQLALAEALGYGDARTYLVFASEIAKIRAKTQDKSGHSGLFDKLRELLKGFGTHKRSNNENPKAGKE